MVEAKKIFQGWFVPSKKAFITPEQREQIKQLPQIKGDTIDYRTDVGALLSTVRSIAEENHISPWEVTTELRIQRASSEIQQKEIKRKYREEIAYVGDVHGGDSELWKRLEKLQDDPPEYLICSGDIVGTNEFKVLQELYYEKVFNTANKALTINPNITDEELIKIEVPEKKNFQGEITQQSFPLIAGYRRLKAYEYELEGYSDTEIQEKVAVLTNEEIAQGIRKCQKYEHYGHYASDLPIKAKQTLGKKAQESAQTFLDMILPLQKQGTRIIILEGNWDARIPTDYEPNNPKAVALPREKRLFRPENFFRDAGIEFCQDTYTIGTETTMQILLPFDEIIRFSKMSREELMKDQHISQACTLTEQARQQNKSVIVVAHGQPEWEMHFLANKSNKPSKENKQIIEGLRNILPIFHPDEIIYGHQHEIIKDEEGKERDINDRYALHITDFGTSIVENTPVINSDTSIASYIPLRRVSKLSLIKRGLVPQIVGEGAIRQPLHILEDR